MVQVKSSCKAPLELGALYAAPRSRPLHTQQLHLSLVCVSCKDAAAAVRVVAWLVNLIGSLRCYYCHRHCSNNKGGAGEGIFRVYLAVFELRVRELRAAAPESECVCLCVCVCQILMNASSRFFRVPYLARKLSRRALSHIQYPLGLALKTYVHRANERVSS